MPPLRTKSFQGTRFFIDRPKGFVKVWPRHDGGEKRFQYPCDYGYFPGLTGEDGEGLDAFVGDDPGGHFEVFQKLKPGPYGGFVLDETKFLVGVTDEERECIYRLYGDEVHSRRAFRDMSHLREALEKFTPKKKGRYVMDSEKTAFSFQAPWARARQAVSGVFSRSTPAAQVAHATQAARGAFPAHLPTLMESSHRVTMPQRAVTPASVPVVHGPSGTVASPMGFGPNGTQQLNRPATSGATVPGRISPVQPQPQPQPLPMAPRHINPNAQPFAATTGAARQRVVQMPNMRGVTPEQAQGFAMFPRASQRQAGGLGDILQSDPGMVSLMQRDPKIRQFMTNASPSERDALAHMLQQRGGEMNQFKVRQALRDPRYSGFAQYLKTGALRSLARRGAFARLKTADESLSAEERQKRFDAFVQHLRERGVYAGTSHKRVVIPKSKLDAHDLTALGFERVLAAIPEAGQDEFHSYRHPNNLFHLHSHPGRWTMHEDEHPSATMLARTHGPVKAFFMGMPHVVTEGLPGLANYVGGRIAGRKSTADVVEREQATAQGAGTPSVLSKAAQEVLARYKLSGLKQSDMDKLIRGHVVAAPNADRQTAAEEGSVQDRLTRVFDRADARTQPAGSESAAGQLPISAEATL